MLAKSDLFIGGEDTIIPSVQNEELEAETAGVVNRLIMSCGTSRESLSQLYSMFKNSVFALAFSITADYHLSEDCVAETFVRLAQITKFDPNKGDGRGFILTIARNVALEFRRRYRKELSNFFIQSYGINFTNNSGVVQMIKQWVIYILLNKRGRNAYFNREQRFNFFAVK